MSFFGKNIKKIRGVKGLSQQAFSELFDLKRATLGAYEEGRSEPKIDTIIKIANHFSVPIDDLLTSELTVNKLLRFKDEFTVEPVSLQTEQFVKVPCITEKNSEDYVENFSNLAFVNSLPTLSLPLNLGKKLRAYTVLNLEMTNSEKGLYPEDVVVGEYVPNEAIQELNKSDLVLVLVNDRLILRKLFVTAPDITLRAEHKNLPDITFPLSEVRELWVIRYVFLKRVPEINNMLEEKLLFLEQEFIRLKNRL